MNKVSSFSRKLITCMVAGLTTAALLLQLGNSGTLAWFPPVLVFSLVGISLVLALIFPIIWHRNEDTEQHKVYGLLYGIIRYTVAFGLACFGWRKILGLQFVVPDSIAGLPMNQQSGEWLTWYYFGHSEAFATIIALLQIIGSYLLLFRKTQLAAAFVLFALMLNLTLINIFYQMNAGALLQSILLTIGIMFLILLEYKRLVVFFFSLKTNVPSISFKSNLAKNAIRLSAILLSFLFTFYLKSLIK